MTAIAKSADLLTPEEYLEGERYSEVRHEYVDGRVYAMASASDDHNRIVGNLFGALHTALGSKQCEPFMTDMKVKIPARFADVFYYPDIIVVCDDSDNATYYRERPSVIFEVLSPDTERTDRREKALAYRHIEAVKVYALVEQERIAITMLRQAKEGWDKETVEGPNSLLKLPEIGVEIPVSQIYERTAAAKLLATSP